MLVLPQYQLFHTLKESYEANIDLGDSLDASSVWDLPPLIELALEELGEAVPTVPYRAAQERLQAQESMSVAGILSIVTGVLELGGAFMAAEPPVLLALAVASAVLGIIDNAQEFFELRTKDRAYLASLNPQLSLAVVIGANDVVNPDARDNPKSPIAGMPIIEVDRAHNVVVLKRGKGKGFSGLENPLFFKPNTGMLYGDAKSSLSKLAQAVQQA